MSKDSPDRIIIVIALKNNKIAFLPKMFSYN
jgi:hypothetical protein